MGVDNAGLVLALAGIFVFIEIISLISLPPVPSLIFALEFYSLSVCIFSQSQSLDKQLINQSKGKFTDIDIPALSHKSWTEQVLAPSKISLYFTRREDRNAREAITK